MSSYISDRVLQEIVGDAVDPVGWAPPVSLHSLARRLGVGAITNVTSVEGCVDLAVERPVIRLARDLSGNRRRFTLAHEIGHVLVYRAQREGRLQVSDQLERLCDRVAAKILLPDAWISPIVDRQWSLGELEVFATQAEVSVAVLVNRMSDLGGCTTWFQAQQVEHTRHAASRWVVVQRAGAKGPFSRRIALDTDTSHALCDLQDGLHRRRVCMDIDGRFRTFDATVRKRGVHTWIAFTR